MSEPKPSKPASGRGLIVPIAAIAGALALGGYGLWTLYGGAGGPRSAAVGEAPEGCILGNLDQVGGPISLVDKNGRSVTQDDLKGAPTLVYFGFTLCPDVCSPSLYTIGDAQRLLGDDIGPLQTVFISLDPERDTTDVIEQFIATPGFPENLIGLTGSVETRTMDNVAAAASAFRVNAARVDTGDGQYLINHTSFMYVMDDQWRTQAMISTPTATPEAVAACVRAALAPGR